MKTDIQALSTSERGAHVDDRGRRRCGAGRIRDVAGWLGVSFLGIGTVGSGLLVYFAGRPGSAAQRPVHAAVPHHSLPTPTVSRRPAIEGNERIFQLADDTILHFESRPGSSIAEITQVKGSIASSDSQTWEVDLGGIAERVALITVPNVQLVALVRDDANETALVKVPGIGKSDFLTAENIFAFASLRQFDAYSNVGDIVDFEVSPDQLSALVLHEATRGSGQHRLISFNWADTSDERLFRCPVQVLSDVLFPSGAPFDLTVSTVNDLWTIKLGPDREDQLVQVDPKTLPHMELATACEPDTACK